MFSQWIAVAGSLRRPRAARPNQVLFYLVACALPVCFLALVTPARESSTVPRIHSSAARIIGDRVRGARLALGISMDDLSELSELSATSIGKIERGAQSPSAETLVRIATALEIDAGSLISGLSAQDYGQRVRQYTARDFIREQRARERAGIAEGAGIAERADPAGHPDPAGPLDPATPADPAERPGAAERGGSAERSGRADHSGPAERSGPAAG